MYNANGDGSTYEIWGRVVAWNGASMGAEFLIITWANRTFWTPRLAWNSYRNEYLVVWNAMDTASLTPTDIAHALLAADGTKLFGTIISAAEQPHQVDVTYNLASDEYLVVWRNMHSAADGDIRGARVEGGGAVVVSPPGAFAISAPIQDQMLPSVTTNQQHRYMVVWQQAAPGPCCDWDIYGRELDINGNPVGGETLIALTGDDETKPQVAARPGTGRDYLVVWERATAAGSAIWASRLGDVPWDYFQLAAVAFWDNQQPSLARGRAGALVLYAADSQGDPTVSRHIYSRTWTSDITFVPLVVR